jgi:glutathione synthase/RimK-type ligase-like ATP-grasp enzyme
MFFNKEKSEKKPFFGFGEKEAVYFDFFKQGTLAGADMYIASKEKNYRGELKFKDPLFFDGKKFKKISGIIIANAIYDRSGGLKFPSKKISRKVLNNITFKSLCYNKNKMYETLGDFMPKSFKIKNQKDFEKKIKLFSPNEMVVIKPSEGLGGKGIIIDTVSNIIKLKLTITKETVLQKFVDTSFGIRNITRGRHDLRVVIVFGKIIFASLRTPKEGSLLANVAQGGKIKEIPLEKIPAEVKSVVSKIQKILDKKFDYPIYSIDLGIENTKPFVFELNDQIGFPSKKMRSYKLFNEALVKSLQKIAARK